MTAHSAVVARAQLAIAAVAREVLEEARRGGVEMPECFPEFAARAIGTRAKSALLDLGWKYFHAGVDRSKANEAAVATNDAVTVKIPVSDILK